jgi:hypothetical protein
MTWFIPEKPLRTTVASAHKKAGEEAGETFSMPSPEQR